MEIVALQNNNLANLVLLPSGSCLALYSVSTTCLGPVIPVSNHHITQAHLLYSSNPRIVFFCLLLCVHRSDSYSIPKSPSVLSSMSTADRSGAQKWALTPEREVLLWTNKTLHNVQLPFVPREAC